MKQVNIKSQAANFLQATSSDQEKVTKIKPGQITSNSSKSIPPTDTKSSLKRKSGEVQQTNTKKSVEKSKKFSESQKQKTRSPSPSSETSCEYEVEQIIDKKVENKGVFYLVKWKGWDMSQSSWEPEENLFNVKEMIEEFDAKKKYVKKNDTDSEDSICRKKSEKTSKGKNKGAKKDTKSQIEEEDVDGASMFSKFAQMNKDKGDTKLKGKETKEEENQPQSQSSQQQQGDENIEYVFECILDKRQLPGKPVEYLIKFSNSNESSWEEVTHLESIADEINEFESKRNKEKDLKSKSKQKGQVDSKNKKVDETYEPPQESLDSSHPPPHTNKRKNKQRDAEGKSEQANNLDDDFEDSNSQNNNNNNNNNEGPQKLGKGIQKTKQKRPRKQNRPQDTLTSQSVTAKPYLNTPSSLQLAQPPVSSSSSSSSIQLSIKCTDSTQQQKDLHDQFKQATQYSLYNVTNNINGENLDIGCFFKGDKSQSVNLIDKNTLFDLQRAIFNVLWKSRPNGIVPKQTQVSYQMLKQLDPFTLINFYELLHSNPPSANNNNNSNTNGNHNTNQ